MIVLTFCLRRASHLSLQQFQQYWLETHGPLVRSLLPAIKASRYMQLHANQDPTGSMLAQVRGAPAAFDGIAQMWWDSQSDFDASLSSSEGRAAGRALLADERNFIDLTQSPIWLNTAYVYEP